MTILKRTLTPMKFLEGHMFEIDCIEEIGSWKKSGLDEWDYISDKLSLKFALLSSKIYFPKFIHHEGFYIVEYKYNEKSFSNGLSNWRSSKNMSEQDFEKSWNNVKLYDIFSNSPDDVCDKILEKIAEIMVFSWLSSLSIQYPDKKFIVNYRNSDQEYGPIVTAYQKKVQG